MNKADVKAPPTSIDPVISSNLAINPSKFLTFSLTRFATLL